MPTAVKEYRTRMVGKSLCEAMSVVSYCKCFNDSQDSLCCSANRYIECVVRPIIRLAAIAMAK